jgi:3-phenylpropionate/cinnamic acid dioxygenase small subunit
MQQMLDTLRAERAIKATLVTYARACDQRDWRLLDSVFTDAVAVDYGGEFVLNGRADVVAMIKSMLGGCGPTQHLLGNFTIAVQDNAASCRCYVRAVHAGLAEQADTYYEVWAEYVDQLVHTVEGWRIKQRSMLVHKEVGSRAILKP